MKSRSRGFTVLEVLMVVLLLGVVARMVVGIIPEKRMQEPLQRLQDSASWAWQQAQLDGRIWRLQLMSHSWQFSTLSSQPTSEPGPLPHSYWSAVTGLLAQGKIKEGKFSLNSSLSLPATLWFLPDGEISDATVVYLSEDGSSQRLVLDAENLSKATP